MDVNVKHFADGAIEMDPCVRALAIQEQGPKFQCHLKSWACYVWNPETGNNLVAHQQTMLKENVVYLHNKMFVIFKKNEIMKFTGQN